jgi:DNA polymerase III subunit epsilon
MILFFDTETTGKADFKAPVRSPRQPYLVQLAAILTDESGEEMSSLNVIIKPNGYTIPEDAAAIHGITQSIAMEYGVARLQALPLFLDLLKISKRIVAHNLKFDSLVMQIEFARSCFPDKPLFDPVQICTMSLMTPHCAIPNSYGFPDFKWPKLQEAYRHAFGKEFEGAHDALADVKACKEIYFWLKKKLDPSPSGTAADLSK